MPNCSQLETKRLVWGALLAAGGVHADEPLVAVLVHGPESPVDVGAAIPIVVDIANNLDQPITHAAYFLAPTANNDEARGITVQAVYRDRMERAHPSCGSSHRRKSTRYPGAHDRARRTAASSPGRGLSKILS